MDDSIPRRALNDIKANNWPDKKHMYLVITLSTGLPVLAVPLWEQSALPGPPILAAVPIIGIMFGYFLFVDSRLRSQAERRRRIVNNAVGVPCSIEETYLASSRGIWGTQAYWPAVEFTYERDGTEHRSYYPYPDGVHEVLPTTNEAQARVTELAEQAGDTAYYDPESDQAFLFNDAKSELQTQYVGKQFMAALILISIASLIMSLVS